MGLYLDDCADSDALIACLTNAGHHVETPRLAGISGRPDHEHLAYAAQHGRALLTKNPDDFETLHHDWQTQERTHGGILLICQDNIKGKDMQPRDIVRAIDHLLISRLSMVNTVHVLNHWRCVGRRERSRIPADLKRQNAPD